jgi:hypothetical protein
LLFVGVFACAALAAAFRLAGVLLFAGILACAAVAAAFRFAGVLLFAGVFACAAFAGFFVVLAIVITSDSVALYSVAKVKCESRLMTISGYLVNHIARRGSSLLAVAFSECP